VVVRHYADIADALHLRDVATATTFFGFWWAITSVVW